MTDRDPPSGRYPTSIVSRAICEACAHGDHGHCGMQSWCQCDDERDGDPDALPDVELELVVSDEAHPVDEYYDPLDEDLER